MTDPAMDAAARSPTSPDPAAEAGMYLIHLLHHICAGWPRRGRKLLEVGCGDGRILELFWTLGFDVTGVEDDPRALEQARARLGDRCECVPGSCGHLPFADESFDYVALVSFFSRAADAPRSGLSGLPAIFAEVGRVATRQIVIVFPNTWSLHWLECLLRKSPERFHNPVAMWRRLRRACPQGHAHWCSLPVGPSSSWQKKSFWPHCNRWRMPVPLGAFAGLHLDLLPATPVTGLPLRVASRLSLAETSPIAPCGATPERD
jgi:SAM-dependent methyltransferase